MNNLPIEMIVDDLEDGGVSGRMKFYPRDGESWMDFEWNRSVAPKGIRERLDDWARRFLIEDGYDEG